MSTTPESQPEPGSAAELTPLLARVATLRAGRRRLIIGITGAPGAGKSTLAERLAGRIPDSVVIPMDGFHLANELLGATGKLARKGAIDTFDLAGYRLLVGRLRADTEQVVYAPAYSRELEQAIAGAIAVTAATRTVITEGNYLLAAELGASGRAPGAPPLFDEVWYIDPPEELRLRRLVQRHLRFGKSPIEAAAWARGPDQANAELIRSTRAAADLIVPTG